jgi:hypothetical protein
MSCFVSARIGDVTSCLCEGGGFDGMAAFARDDFGDGRTGKRQKHAACFARRVKRGALKYFCFRNIEVMI